MHVHQRICHAFHPTVLVRDEKTAVPTTGGRGAGCGRRRVGGLSVVHAAASSSIPDTSVQPSVVIDIAQEEDFARVLEAHSGALVVLMCKAKGCRPCKQFKRKYDTLAAYFTDAVFCEVIGDRNESTRNMMRQMKIRATPTFVFYRNQSKVHEHSGINPQKMIDALEAHVLEGESGYGEEHLHFVANGILSPSDGSEEEEEE